MGTLLLKLLLICITCHSGTAQYYYKQLNPFVSIDVLNACIKADNIQCSVYGIGGLSIQSSCLEANVLRVVGEYDTLRIICSSQNAIDFRYYGIQPTEAIRVEWYKQVEPSSNSTVSAFGVDVQIRSVESLYQFYRKQKADKQLQRHDYPRSGNFEFRNIEKNDTLLNLFVYLEDSGKHSFLRNSQTRVTLKEATVHLPCVPSHYSRNISVGFKNKDGAVKELIYDWSKGHFQGLLVQASDGIDKHYGTYSCKYQEDSENKTLLDELELQYFQDWATPFYRFGLNRQISNDKGPSISYDIEDANNIDIQIACKVHELNAPTQLNAIEAENFAMMNLKREFTFPNFVNRSYTAISVSTSGELTFEIRIPEKFHTRYGGATYCKSGENLEVVEFAVPFVGKVSKRKFDTDWTAFDRRESDIQIHFELKMEDGRNVGSGKEVFTGSRQNFVCKIIVAIVVKPTIWTTIWKNGSKIEEKVDYNLTGPLEDTSTLSLTIDNNLIGVECSATFYYASFWRTISLPLHVKSGEPPLIEAPSEELVLRLGAMNQGITCSATGKPTPILTLYKSGSQLFTSLTANGSLLHQILKVEYSNAGEYTCRAENIYGKTEKVFKYVVEGEEGPNYPILVAIPVVVFVITLLGATVYIKFFRKEKVGLTRAEIEEFMAGERNSARHSFAFAHEFAHFNPYDTNYELSDNKFQIDSTDILGSGAYGVVFKGIVDGRPVAVKTTKKNCDKAYLKALLSELKIMIYLGHHENIVELLGASTKYLGVGSVYLFVPFCSLGNLEKYLRSNRHNFEEAFDSEYRNVDQGVFNFNDLLKWSIQIADGMEYMANRKVIHGDLAARNILLTEGKQAKITDFGLSRQLYGYASYVKKQQEPLPWRWMALESLRDLSFSTLSDVWSYGVLLWEIFSLGEVPYPGMAWTLDFVDELENGLRMSRPKRTPEHIYVNVLYLCWHKVPSRRPSFAKIRATLEEFQQTRKCDVEGKKMGCMSEEENDKSFLKNPGNVYVNKN